MKSSAAIHLCAMLFLGAIGAFGQAQTPRPAAATPASAELELRPTYVLGPNDQIQIRVPGSPDFSESPFRIDEAGDITLPLIGKTRAANLSVAQLELDIAGKLRTYLVNPTVSISVVQFRSEPIFVVGAFIRPGIHSLGGRRTLLDTLAALGGLQPNASSRIRVTRRLESGKIPLPSAVENPVDKTSSVEIHLNRFLETVNPAEDIVLEPFDVLSAHRLEQVFVNGEVVRPGPFDTLAGESISLLQLITMAGGLTPDAEAKEIRVLRAVSGSRKRAEIKLNLQDAISGESNDFPILPNDILYVPKKTSIGSAIGRNMLTIGPAIASIVLVAVVGR